MSTPEQNLAEAREHVGKSLTEFKAVCLRKGWKCRVTCQDGENCIGTCDFVPSRANVHVDAGRVTSVESFG